MTWREAEEAQPEAGDQLRAGGRGAARPSSVHGGGAGPRPCSGLDRQLLRSHQMLVASPHALGQPVCVSKEQNLPYARQQAFWPCRRFC